MRAILIDPEAKTFSEIQISSNDDEIGDIQKLVRCENFAIGARLSGSYMQGYNESVLVSDDYLEVNTANTRFWFQIDADRDPPTSHSICGRGLVTGGLADKSAELRISIEDLAKRVTFTQRKFRGFNVDHDDPYFDIVVTTDAPIIETE